MNRMFYAPRCRIVKKVENVSRRSKRSPLRFYNVLHNDLNTVSKEEVAKFARLSKGWWDPEGHAKILHRMNPPRVSYIRTKLCEQLEMDHLTNPKPFCGLEMLDVGCGGGLLTESLARLGATVTGIDVVDQNISICRDHAFAEGSPFTEGKNICYKLSTAEELAVTERERFDVVCSLEVVEHVANVELFVDSIVQMTKPGGHIFISTINRTPRSLFLTKLIAEYLCQWVPVGTHEWTKYITPQELIVLLRRHQCYILNASGLDFDPSTELWHLNPKDVSCNYIIHASRPQLND